MACQHTAHCSWTNWCIFHTKMSSFGSHHQLKSAWTSCNEDRTFLLQVKSMPTCALAMRTWCGSQLDLYRIIPEIWLPTWESECVYFKDSRVNKLHIWCRQVVLNAGIFCPVHASLPVGNVKVSIMYAGGGKGTCVFVCPSFHMCFMGISPFQMTRSLLQIFHAVLNLPLQLFSNVFVPTDSQARSVAVCPVCSVVCLTSARNPFWGGALDWQSLVNIKKWSWIGNFLKIHHLCVVFQHKTMHFIC